MAEAAQIRLAIGARQTRITDSGSGRNWMLGIGTEALGGGPFRHEPPTPLEIEHAIEHVEDAVMPLLRELPTPASWVSADAASWQLHGLLPRAMATGTAVLSIDAVEDLFNQLAAVSLGRPTASSGLPVQAAFMAHVLILREAMHHLRFSALGLIADPD